MFAEAEFVGSARLLLIGSWGHHQTICGSCSWRSPISLGEKEVRPGAYVDRGGCEGMEVAERWAEGYGDITRVGGIRGSLLLLLTWK